MIKTSFTSLTESLNGGFNFCRLTIITGANACGKSTLTLQLAEFAALNGHAVTVVALESARQDIHFDAMARRLGADYSLIENGSTDLIQAEQEYQDTIAKNLLIDESNNQNDAVKLAGDNHAELIVLPDSIEPGSGRRLKQLARSTQSAIVAVANSGENVDSADIVLHLYSDPDAWGPLSGLRKTYSGTELTEIHNKFEQSSHARLDIVKNRYGINSSHFLVWNRPCHHFSSLKLRRSKTAPK